jgi:hypothetical protein
MGTGARAPDGMHRKNALGSRNLEHGHDRLEELTLACKGGLGSSCTSMNRSGIGKLRAAKDAKQRGRNGQVISNATCTKRGDEIEDEIEDR